MSTPFHRPQVLALAQRVRGLPEAAPAHFGCRNRWCRQQAQDVSSSTAQDSRRQHLTILSLLDTPASRIACAAPGTCQNLSRPRWLCHSWGLRSRGSRTVHSLRSSVLWTFEWSWTCLMKQLGSRVTWSVASLFLTRRKRFLTQSRNLCYSGIPATDNIEHRAATVHN